MAKRIGKLPSQNSLAISAVMVIAVVAFVGIGINRAARKQISSTIQTVLNASGEKYDVTFDRLDVSLWSRRLELGNLTLQNLATKKSWRFEKITVRNWSHFEALRKVFGLSAGQSFTQFSVDFQRLHLNTENLSPEAQKLVRNLNYDELVLSFGGTFATNVEKKTLDLKDMYVDLDQGGRLTLSAQFHDYQPSIWREVEGLPLSAPEKLRMRKALVSKVMLGEFSLRYDDTSFVSRMLSARRIDRSLITHSNVMQVFFPSSPQPQPQYTLQPVKMPIAPSRLVRAGLSSQKINLASQSHGKRGRVAARASTLPSARSPASIQPASAQIGAEDTSLIYFKPVRVRQTEQAPQKSEFMDLFVAQLLTFVRAPHTFLITAKPDAPMMLGQVADLFRSNRDGFARLLKITIAAK